MTYLTMQWAFLKILFIFYIEIYYIIIILKKNFFYDKYSVGKVLKNFVKKILGNFVEKFLENC